MLILILFLAIIIGLFIGSLLLYLCTKIFKVKNLNYGKIFKVYFIGFIFSVLFGLTIEIFFKSIEISFFGDSILMLIIFYILLKKLFSLSSKKIIGILFIWFALNLIVSMTIVVPIKNYIAQPFYVNGDTMEPALSDGDYILIKVYDKNYQRGDIIVFEWPKKPNNFLIKRIIGLPGEKVVIENNKIYINNLELMQDELNIPGTFGNVNLQLDQDEFFVLGDNRAKSLDSRLFGPIKINSILGKHWLKNKFVSEIFENIY